MNELVTVTADTLATPVRRPLGARVALFSMIAGIAVLLTWAGFAQIDQVTRAPAQIIAAERTQIIQAAESGVVTRMHVKEGDSVSAGQLLVTLEKERAQAAVSDSSAKAAALKITLKRLEAEVFGQPLVFEKELHGYQDYIRNQTQLYERRRTAFRQDIDSLERILNIAKEELKINEKLLKTGDVSRAEVLKLQRSVADLSAQLGNRRNKYFQDAQADMTKAQEELNTQLEQLRDRSQVLEHMELVAPVDGIVNSIRATTLGAVLRPGDIALELFPTGGDLIAEAKVTPADIAFVEVDQEAFVKLDAYDSTIFGSLKGQVKYISPDVLKEEGRQGPVSYYRVHILVPPSVLETKRTRDIILRPGLTATVEIKARERSVLSYLTKPITKTMQNAFGER
jgi:membrane fusion protein, adhesin transport system